MSYIIQHQLGGWVASGVMLLWDRLVTDLLFVFQVVAYGFDQVDESLSTQYHETIYSLLDSLSPAYRDAFGNALLQRLEALKKLQQ